MDGWLVKLLNLGFNTNLQEKTKNVNDKLYLPNPFLQHLIKYVCQKY